MVIFNLIGKWGYFFFGVVVISQKSKIAKEMCIPNPDPDSIPNWGYFPLVVERRDTEVCVFFGQNHPVTLMFVLSAGRLFLLN